MSLFRLELLPAEPSEAEDDDGGALDGRGRAGDGCWLCGILFAVAFLAKPLESHADGDAGLQAETAMEPDALRAGSAP